MDEALNSSNYHISLDTSFKEDDNAEYNLYDILLSNDTPDPDNDLLNKSLKEDIDRTMEALTDRESEILKYYYGLNGFHTHSLIEIGGKLQLTRERVRQIKDKALKKLQYARNNEILKIYVA